MATIQVTSNTTLSALAYAQADTINIKGGARLTVDASSGARPGTVQCTTSGELYITNASTTSPLVFSLNSRDADLIFQNSGRITIRGAMMEIGTTAGSALSWNFATLYSGALDWIGYVEGETNPGSGIYRPHPIILTAPARYNSLNYIGVSTESECFADGTDLTSYFFYNLDNKTLTTGGGVNSSNLSAGRKIRIPNIYIRNRHSPFAEYVHAIQLYGQAGVTATGGTFTVTVINDDTGVTLGTTAALAYNVANATLQTALNGVLTAAGVSGTFTITSGPLPTAVGITNAGGIASTGMSLRVDSSITGNASPVYQCRMSSAANMSTVNLQPGGRLDAECCTFSPNILITPQACGATRFHRVGLSGPTASVSSTNATSEWDCVSFVVGPFTSSGANGLSSVFNTVTFRDVVTTSRHHACYPQVSNVAEISGNRIDRVRSYSTLPVKENASSVGASFNNLPAGVVIADLATAGNPPRFSLLSDAVILSPRLARNTGSALSAVQPRYGIELNACVNPIVSDVRSFGGTSNAYSALYTDANTLNVQCFGATLDGKSSMYGLMVPNNYGAKLQNMKLSAARLTNWPLIDAPTNFATAGIELRKCFVSYGNTNTWDIEATQAGVCDVVTCKAPSNVTNTFQGVEEWVCGNYTDDGLTPITGHITFGPFCNGSTFSATGSAYARGNGYVDFLTAGDSFTVESLFSMHGVTGFRAVEPVYRGYTIGGAATQHMVINPGGVTGGTFQISLYTANDTLIGTTTAQAYNAVSATVQTAVLAVLGAGNATVSGSLAGGLFITTAGAYAATPIKVTVNGSALTGGTYPGQAFAYSVFRALAGETQLGSLSVEIGMRAAGMDWSAWASATAANAQALFAGLVGYDPANGLDMRLRCTASQTDPLAQYQYLNIAGFFTTIDPTLWTLYDASITLQGADNTDTVEVVRASDDATLYTFTGSGLKTFDTGANYATPVYFVRKNSAGRVLMTTYPDTQTLSIGSNGAVALFYGAQVQLAQSVEISAVATDVTAISATLATRPTLAQIVAAPELAKESTVAARATQLSVDALATANQTEHDATQAALALIPTGTLLATDARLGNLDAPVSSRLATAGYTAPTAAPTAADNAAAVRANLATELARIDVATSTRLATAGYTAPTAAPTAAAIRTEIEAAGGKLDAAMKAAKAAKRQTL